MEEKQRSKCYFSGFEIGLWTGSVATILLVFFLFPNDGYLSLVASLIGVTALIFIAKGNPLGQLLMVVFAAIYGVISFGFAYYGEMMTYVGMSAPMALFSLLVWLRNPYNGNRAEVRVNHIRLREIPVILCLTLAVTVVFYFVLKAFHTANLIPSTLSVATSFLAVYLSFRRSAYFAVAYAANDIVLILLWTLATIRDFSYLSVVICFAVFLVNDLHSFVAWQKMSMRQKKYGYATPSSAV